jgi:transcriptional regulator with XRE-family HTH domain
MTEVGFHFIEPGLLLFMEKTFGQWLTMALKRADMKQSDLAERTKLSKSYISTLANDAPGTAGRPPRPEEAVVEKIARAIGVSIEEARAAAGYAPRKGNYRAHEALMQSRFGLMMRKFEKINQTDRPLI